MFFLLASSNRLSISFFSWLASGTRKPRLKRVSLSEVERLSFFIDFKRDLRDIPAKVIAIEYDPNRSSRIALLEYGNKEKRYILAPAGLKVNDEIISTLNKDVEIKIGN